MISVEQIRAARGLLGWSQIDLAREAGLSKTVVNNLERQLVQPRSRTLDIIRRTFEERGVEWVGRTGVDLKNDRFHVEVIEGDESIGQYFRDIIDSIRGTNEVALHFNVDDQMIVDEGHQEEMHQYCADMKRFGLRDKILVREGDMVRYGPYETSQYRWIPEALFSQTGYSVYGDTYSIFMFGEVDRVINIRNPLIADVYRTQFEATWKMCKPQPKVKSLFDVYEG